MQPTLVIGLGGTGTGVLEDLRQRFVLHTGKPDLSGVEFLYIDSDRNHNETLTRYQDQSHSLTMAGSAADYAKPDSGRRQQLQLDRWFDLQRLNDLNNQDFAGGVGGIRMYGRLLFLDSVELSAIMENIIIKLQYLAARDEGAPQIFVIASAGGGTGSGTFIDMGYLLGHVLEDAGMANIRREGIVALHAPNIQTPESQMKQNSAAMLVELDYFCDPRHHFFANYNGQAVSPQVGSEAPYDFIALVTPTQDGDPLDVRATEALTRLRAKIADYLFLRILEGADAQSANGTDLASPTHTQGSPAARLKDTAVNWTGGQTDTEGYPVRFMTFGVSLRQYPIGKNTHTVNRSTIWDIQQRWLSVAEANEMYLASSYFNDVVHRQRYDKDLEDLSRMLGIPKPHVQENGSIRAFDPDAVANRLIQMRPGNLEDLKISLNNAATSREKLDSKFAWKPSMDLAPNRPGYIAGTIQQNCDEMIDSNQPESLPSRVKNYLTEITLDWNRGPRWTLSLLRESVAPLRTEIAVLSDIKKLSLPSVDAAETTKPTPAQAHYAECLFEREIVGAKWTVLTACQKIMVTEKKRAEQFVRYLEAWQRRTGGSINVIDGTSRSSTVALTDAESKAIRNALLAVTFPQSQSLPQYQGQTDFRPFAEIEKRVSYLAVEQATPVLEWLNEQAADNGTNIKAIAEDMVRESRPLINLNLGMDGYRQMITKPVRWVACWWCESYPDTRDELYQEWYEAAKAKALGMSSLQVQQGNVLVNFPSASPSILGLVFLRTAFPTRILRGYEPEKRLDVLANSNAGAFSFVRSPISKAIQNKARRLLTIALVLTWGKIEQRTNRRQQAMATQLPQLQNKNDAGQADANSIRFDWVDAARIRRHVDLPSDFEAAIYQLALNEPALKALETQIAERERSRPEQGALQQVVQSHRQDLHNRMAGNTTTVDLEREIVSDEGAATLAVRGVSLKDMDEDLKQWGSEKLGMPIE